MSISKQAMGEIKFKFELRKNIHFDKNSIINFKGIDYLIPVDLIEYFFENLKVNVSNKGIIIILKIDNDIFFIKISDLNPVAKFTYFT